jgi:hypothetical protein
MRTILIWLFSMVLASASESLYTTTVTTQGTSFHIGITVGGKVQYYTVTFLIAPDPTPTPTPTPTPKPTATPTPTISPTP